eukprot:TRINITY_DN3368_c0_g2_i4.p7 TRINITY_DN3368_c0_g2~~TRINITY_DN3368_c0_g2_i4.p7  ORF type:complete len:309 (+),score=7.70 TRINITY_DN3368_c0_g2_i4:1705-2631(+)
MEYKKSPIILVTVCNDKYSVLLAALLKSIEVNHHTEEFIQLYIVNDAIGTINRTKVEASINKKIVVNWVEISDVYPKNVSLPLDSSTFPLNVYVRLFIPHFLPSHLTKAIYLDVDMIVKRDISELWDVELGDHYIAGVPDLSEKISSEWAGVANYKDLGLNGDAKYYNSGLLVMNLAKWRPTALSSEILKCIDQNRQFANFPDQYGLNVVFADKWLELDKRWNTYAPTQETNPFIIHFIGRKPIYKTYENNPSYKREFLYYLNLTQFAGFSELKEYDRMLHKLLHKLGKKGAKMMRMFKNVNRTDSSQ